MKLEITLQQGGMREFERTGIYPEYLLFNLPGTLRIGELTYNRLPQSQKKSSLERHFKKPVCCGL
jgi:hypothetical protein